ncbi:anti-sigma-D factor RsdA [Skermania piniformis]|uniref:Type IV secretion protein Rhs n=1 Tax=Skermania pinensis TaxID=39122 RepID=A0ABX8SA00_9ACTN|nr:anti-sigma-D factor RsdA [Skermania piniformis]QXQ14647.1 type IV secretion protein Rhs [Skermania piniformis]
MARDWREVGSDWRRDEPYADHFDDGVPVDIAAVRRDDALIDAIAGDGPVATDDDDEYRLAVLLTAWRADIVTTPLPAGPDLDTVADLVEQELAAVRSRRSIGSRLWLVRPIAGAAALVALAMGGMTAISYNAEPGDPLWKVKEVVFADQADSTVAQVDTRSDLNHAEELLSTGNAPEAKMYLDRASQRVGDVGDTRNRDQLLDRWNELMNKVNTLSQSPTTPAAPAVVVPTTVDPALTIPQLPSTAVLVPTMTDTPSFPTVPGLPGVQLPPEATLPTIPSLPQFGGGTAPKVEVPQIDPPTVEVPSVSVPTMPSLPAATVPGSIPSNLTVPSVPSVPTVEIPELPAPLN